jgi:hypothetical protein
MRLASIKGQRCKGWVIAASSVAFASMFVVSGCGATELPRGNTLRVTPRPIVDFARAGERIAWRVSAADGRDRIVVEDLGDRSRRLIDSSSGQRVALAGDRVLWTVDQAVPSGEASGSYKCTLSLLTTAGSTTAARRVWSGYGYDIVEGTQCRLKLPLSGGGKVSVLFVRNSLDSSGCPNSFAHG